MLRRTRARFFSAVLIAGFTSLATLAVAQRGGRPAPKPNPTKPSSSAKTDAAPADDSEAGAKPADSGQGPVPRRARRRHRLLLR